MVIFALLTTVFLVLATIYDVRLTEKGLLAKVAEEGTDWLVGSHPTAKALYLRDGLVGGALAVSALGFASVGHPISAMFSTACLAYAIRHIQGGMKWAALLHGQTQGPRSAWQKFWY